MLLGLVLGAVFLLVESRAADPIVPLGLFRLRTFSISVAATFFVGVRVPRPRSSSCRAGSRRSPAPARPSPGYNLLPLLAGLIFSAVASGQIVARVGRYKLLMFGSLALLARRRSS